MLWRYESHMRYCEKEIFIDGMSCVNCQSKIEQKLRNTKGIKEVHVSYAKESAKICFDTNVITEEKITQIIQKLGYEVRAKAKQTAKNWKFTLAVFSLILALYFFISYFGLLNYLIPGQLADSKMGFGMLFLIGIFTSVHCIAMCGGINLSQCIPKGVQKENALAVVEKSKMQTLRPAFLYNAGRVISYTVIGFLLGAVGLLFGGNNEVGLPLVFQGGLKLIAGIFMVIMGINMLGAVPSLRRFQLKMPKIFAVHIMQKKRQSSHPFVVGLCNGLMPCGPLQSMQIVALASANPFVGAASMFFFSLGTVPLMLGFGSMVSALGQKFAKRVMFVGSVLVVVLGLAMLSQGGSLIGLNTTRVILPLIVGFFLLLFTLNLPLSQGKYKALSIAAATCVLLVFTVGVQFSFVGATTKESAGTDTKLVNGTQEITSALSSNAYPSITVAVNTPVKWNITAEKGDINGCNYQMSIPSLGVKKVQFQEGDNVIEFTPTKTGTYEYSCWMGMIHATVTVAKEGQKANVTDNQSSSTNDNTTVQGNKSSEKGATAEVKDGVQYVTSGINASGYEPIIVEENIPVKWTLHVDKGELTYCNNAIYVPEYNLKMNLKEGDNVIEFTPTSSGSFVFSCWMGMTYGKITVTHADGSVDATKDDGSGSLPSCCG